MYVRGFTKSTFSPFRMPSLTRPLYLEGANSGKPQRSRSVSIARNPALWRVFAYSGPGFPSQAMHFIRESIGGNPFLSSSKNCHFPFCCYNAGKFFSYGNALEDIRAFRPAAHRLIYCSSCRFRGPDIHSDCQPIRF